MYKKSWLTYLCDVVCWILTSVIQPFQEVRFHVLKAVAIVTSEHLNLSTNLAVSLIKTSSKWRLKPGFGTRKKCSFPLNRDVPSIEVTNRQVMYGNILAGPSEWRCPLNTEVSRRRGSIIIIDRRLNSNKSYNNYKLQSIYYYAYLNRSLMHPHCEHSHAHPMDCVDNSQWHFHLPDTEHRSAKSFHFLDQTVPRERWHQKDTQVDDRLLAHLLYPRNRHKPFPRYLCNRSPLCPLQASFPQSVSRVLVYELEVNSYLGFEKQTTKRKNK